MNDVQIKIKMRIITYYLVLALVTFSLQIVVGQETVPEKIEILDNLKARITLQEKEALKLEVEIINEQLKENILTTEEAKSLKEAAAKKRAMNIENRIAIIDNKIELLKRNGNEIMELDTLNYATQLFLGFGGEDAKNEQVFGIKIKKNPNRSKLKYDRRTYSDLVLAVGLNNTLIDGQSLEDSPYRIGGSRFFEIGWVWRTRVFENTNFLRLHYGFSFQFNGLKPTENQIFVTDNGQTVLEEFEFDLQKSKFRTDNLVFPVHFEFGPSKYKEKKNAIRYSLRNQFRLGIGGYGGFNLGTRQKLKYRRDGERVKDKLKRDYNTTNFVYGLSAYIGFDGVQLYAKYDLNPLFKNATIEQHNISLGFRFDL